MNNPNSTSILHAQDQPQPLKKDEAQAKIWDDICSILRRELSDRSYQQWFEPVRFLYFSNNEITLGVPDSYFGQWLKDHYHDLLLSSIFEATNRRCEVSYSVFETEVKPAAKQTARPSPVKQIDPALSSLNSHYTFDDFVIGPNNRFPHAAAMAVCEAPARQYNPLFIHGSVGLGKTHLMQSIAHEFKRRNPNFKVLYISSEKFTNQLINAIQTRTTIQFRNKYRNLDLLLIDDIHFIAEKEATQEEFFHTFNALYDAHKQIVVSSDRPPREIPGLEERLVSRFGWGLVADIHPPDFETRVAILKKKMEKETVVVPDDVCYFIAEKLKSNVRELEGALIRVVAYCALTGARINLELAQQVLKDSFKEEAEKISIDKIQRTVADYFQLKVSDLRAKRRTKSVAFPRQVAMYLIRTLTSHSLPEIGEYFGGRDHTTVLHSFNKISREIEKNVAMRNSIDEIKSLLKKPS